MSIRLYGIPLSHPVIAAKLALEHKGLAYKYVDLLGGSHPLQLRALGFKRVTVPAMKLADGRRVQGSLAISAALEELQPAPTLYPTGDAAHAAERWGESALQPVSRRMIRFGMRSHLSQRQWFADVASPLPAPKVMGALLTPVVPIFTHQVGATEATVRADVAAVPGLLDEVDRLLGDGVIGGDDLGAADFQIATTVRMLGAFEDVGRLVAGRPADAFSRRVVADYPPIPAALPREWF